MLQHYEGILGMFEYDDEVWEILEADLRESFIMGRTGEYLSYRGAYIDSDVTIPKGCCDISCSFAHKSIIKGFKLKDLDTSEVQFMNGTFQGTKFGDDVSFGDNFNTGQVKSMRLMFGDAKFGARVTLGANFDTRNVVSMASMFTGAVFPESFDLGSKFDTRKVNDMTCMFYRCCFGENRFSLGEHFYTEGVDMDSMFKEAIFPRKEFVVGNHFILLDDSSNMFNGCRLPSYCECDPKTSDAGDILDELKKGNPYLKDGENRVDNKLMLNIENSLAATLSDIYYINNMLKKAENDESIDLDKFREQLSTCTTSVNVVELVIKEVKDKMMVNCKKKVEKILQLKVGDHSRYTVGEVVRLVKNRSSYPEDVIYKSIVECLDDQYLY